MSMSISSAGAGMPSAVSGASMRMPPQQKMENLFSQIDTSGKGSITKSQFDTAFQSLKPPPGFKAMGSDAAFASLDPKGTGSVSKADFVDGMKTLMTTARSHGRHKEAAATAAPAATLASSLDTLNALASPQKAQDSGSTGGGINLTA